MTPQPIAILFVCLGNICRSPMAEFILKHKAELYGIQNKLIIKSTGTSGFHNGENMHRKTQAMLNQYQIKFANFVSSQITPDDFNYFHHIIAMDDNNLKELQLIEHNNQHKIYQITTLSNNTPFDHVPDPYFSGKFEQTYAILEHHCELLIKKLLFELSSIAES